MPIVVIAEFSKSVPELEIRKEMAIREWILFVSDNFFKLYFYTK